MQNANLFHLQISTKTAVDWYNFICDVCAQYFPVKLGGSSIKVKIDKSKLGCWKYNRGRHVDRHWVFGGTERLTGESFLMEVQQRDMQTLLPIIQQYIIPGSSVYSDGAYSQLQSHNYWLSPDCKWFAEFHRPSMRETCKWMLCEKKTTLFETYLPNLCGEENLPASETTCSLTAQTHRWTVSPVIILVMSVDKGKLKPALPNFADHWCID